MTDDTPTQRLPEPAEATGELAEERKKSKALLFTLAGVGAALLITIVVLLIILFSGDDGEPLATPTVSGSPSATASPTPSDSPTPTPSPEAPEPEPEPEPDTSPGFSSFSATTPVQCPEPVDSGEDQPPLPTIKFSWTAKNAQSVWFVFGTDDAADSGAFEVPISGNQDDVYDDPQNPIYFPCNQAEQKMTLTIVGNNGQHVNKTFTVTNNGYRG